MAGFGDEASFGDAPAEKAGTEPYAETVTPSPWEQQHRWR